MFNSVHDKNEGVKYAFGKHMIRETGGLGLQSNENIKEVKGWKR
jgi:hypothetical protein